MPHTRKPVQLTSVTKHGGAWAITITRAIRDLITWQLGDTIAVRTAGDKLILERVPVEKLAILRTGDAGAGNEGR